MKTYKQYVKELNKQMSEPDIDIEYITHWKDGIAYDYNGNPITKEEYIEECDPVMIYKRSQRDLEHKKKQQAQERNDKILQYIWLTVVCCAVLFGIYYTQGKALIVVAAVLIPWVPYALLWILIEKNKIESGLALFLGGLYTIWFLKGVPQALVEIFIFEYLI